MNYEYTRTHTHLLNIDFMEFFYEYKPFYIDELYQKNYSILKTEQKGRGTIWTINGVLSIKVIKPYGVNGGGVFIKLKNEVLYKNGTIFKSSIELLKDLTDGLNFKGLNRIDFSYDILELDIFKYLNLNELDGLKTGIFKKRKIQATSIINDQGGKTLYLKPDNLKKDGGIYTKIYTKHIELKTMSPEKSLYQNPEKSELLTRIELSISKTGLNDHEALIYLKSLGFCIINEPLNFYKNRNKYIEYFFSTYRDIYIIEYNELELNYEKLFNKMEAADPEYYRSINDFLNGSLNDKILFNKKQKEAVLKYQKKKKEKSKSGFNEVVFKEVFNKLKDFIEDFKMNIDELINDQIILSIIEKSEIEDERDLNYIRIKKEDDISKKLFKSILNGISKMKPYEVEKSEDLFSILNEPLKTEPKIIDDEWTKGL